MSLGQKLKLLKIVLCLIFGFELKQVLCNLKIGGNELKSFLKCSLSVIQFYYLFCVKVVLNRMSFLYYFDIVCKFKEPNQHFPEY